MHFEWDLEVCDRWLIDIVWLIRWWLPVAALAAIVFMLAPATAAIGRILLLFSIGILIGRILSNYRRGMRADEWRWSVITANRLRLMYVAMLLLLATGVFWGLRYSVGIITSRLLNTVCVVLLLAIIHSVLVRWLCVVQRRLRFEELRAARAEKSAKDSETIEEDEAGLLEISEDTMELLGAIAVGLTVVAMLYIWAPLMPAFDLLSDVTLWTSTNVVEGDSIVSQITLETLVIVTLVVGITFYTAHKLPALVELVLRARTEMSVGARYTTRSLMSYVIVAVGVVSALSALGLHWSKLQWLIASLGVGIGFGLQEIVANFFSGLIILFERPIRVGDIVTVGEKDGEVTRIRIRATTIRDLDGKELLVPNKEFITGHLLNWTLSDSQMRIIVEVGVAYGSDLDRALKLVVDVAAGHPKVIQRPAPESTIEKFGDNAVELVIRCFLGEYEGWRGIASELRHEIYQQFTEAGIVIAFPQRDLHFNDEKPVRIVLDSQPTG